MTGEIRLQDDPTAGEATRREDRKKDFVDEGEAAPELNRVNNIMTVCAVARTEREVSLSLTGFVLIRETRRESLAAAAAAAAGFVPRPRARTKFVQ